MTIVGFTFNKIEVEKLGLAQGKINISNNVGIKNVEKTDLSFGKNKQEGLKFTYEFVSKYEPKIGTISLKGEVLYLADDKTIKSSLEQWKKDKKVDKELMEPILNTILGRCNIQALILSKEVNLPPPMPLPKVKTGTDKAQEYIG